MTDPAPHITIALCTYNGAAYLRAQLESYLAQTHKNWSLWISDDGSTDETRAILEDFAARHAEHHKITIVSGPNRGFMVNYMSLLCHPDFPAGMVALSDQDDIWLEDKLARAIKVIGQAETPVLYGAQYLFVDADQRPIGVSKTGRSRPGFGNALVQNIVSGHTAALNPAALVLVRQAGVPADLPFHDWWLYLLITGAGGQVVIDPAQVLLYRQHGGNAVGAHRGLGAHFKRLQMVRTRQFKAWTRANTLALEASSALLTPQARTILKGFNQPQRGPARAWKLRALGIGRQRALSTFGLYLAAMLGRL